MFGSFWFNLINLADYISILFHSIRSNIIYKNPNNETLKYFWYFSSTMQTTIKRLPYPESLYKMSRRPKVLKIVIIIKMVLKRYSWFP